MGQFEGKIALVTGGASGIGRASATRLVAEGATVVVVDVNEDGAKLAAELGGRFIHADVASSADWDRVAAACRDDGLDYAHLNAGIVTGVRDVTELTDAQYRRIMGVNVDGVVFGVRALAPLMRERGGGAIVATASMAGLIAFAGEPVYTLTKHAVVGLVRGAAVSLADHNITINAVCPGIVDTPMTSPGRDMLLQRGIKLLPPEQVADAVVGAITSGRTGQAIVCQVGRLTAEYEFAALPGQWA
jgi:NAD(P)-dependent dehydrogenase (short-subunit alcohol dehydrogenase family)